MFCFSELIGNHHVKEYLKQSVLQKRIGNALLFVGLEGVGKRQFALALAASLLGNDEEERRKIKKGLHPDLHIYVPEGRSALHSMESMRSFSQEVYERPSVSSVKVFIIDAADKMLPYSAHALLKTFEEPLMQSIIILLSDRPAILLKTIRSRCRPIFFHAILQKELAIWLEEKQGLSKERAEKLAYLSQGSCGRALRLKESGGEAMREKLFASFTKGGFTSYVELKACVEGINHYIEKAAEQTAKKESTLDEIDQTTLSALQKESWEKKQEGRLALHQGLYIDQILEWILEWFRDLSFLCVHQASLAPHFINRDFEEVLKKQALQGNTQKLSHIESAVEHAKLGIERFLPLHTVFETLFLQINLLR